MIIVSIVEGWGGERRVNITLICESFLIGLFFILYLKLVFLVKKR